MTKILLRAKCNDSNRFVARNVDDFSDIFPKDLVQILHRKSFMSNKIYDLTFTNLA